MNSSSYTSPSIEQDFLNAASAGNVDVIKKMLDNKAITLNSLSNPDRFFLGAGRPLVDIALYRLSNNLEGVKLLLETYHVPLPSNFLSAVKNHDVALYLIQKQKVNPYQKGEEREKRFDDGDCFYFSEANIKRLQTAAGEYRSLRPEDYAVIGSTLNSLLDIIITEVKEGFFCDQALHFQCASPKEAEILADFLQNKCGLALYYTFEGHKDVYYLERGFHTSHSDFIRAVGKKAGIFQEEIEPKSCCSIW